MHCSISIHRLRVYPRSNLNLSENTVFDGAVLLVNIRTGCSSIISYLRGF